MHKHALDSAKSIIDVVPTYDRWMTRTSNRAGHSHLWEYGLTTADGNMESTKRRFDSGANERKDESCRTPAGIALPATSSRRTRLVIDALGVARLA